MRVEQESMDCLKSALNLQSEGTFHVLYIMSLFDPQMGLSSGPWGPMMLLSLTIPQGSSMAGPGVNTAPNHQASKPHSLKNPPRVIVNSWGCDPCMYYGYTCIHP